MKEMTIDSIIEAIRKEINFHISTYRMQPDKVALGREQCEVIESFLKSNKFSQGMSIEKNTICGLKIERTPILDHVEAYKEW